MAEDRSETRVSLEGLGSGLARIHGKCVAKALCSAQLTYFKKKSIKCISKFPLLTYRSSKFSEVRERKSHKMKQICWIPLFCLPQGSSWLPENHIFHAVSAVILIYTSSPVLATITTQKIRSQSQPFILNIQRHCISISVLSFTYINC